jgi:hypothetical protein
MFRADFLCFASIIVKHSHYLLGIELDEQVVAALSPYLCQHINRFGRYQLDLTQSPPPLNYDIQVITKRSKKRTTTNRVAAISPKKAKPKRKKKNPVRQMKLL